MSIGKKISKEQKHLPKNNEKKNKSTKVKNNKNFIKKPQTFFVFDKKKNAVICRSCKKEEKKITIYSSEIRTILFHAPLKRCPSALFPERSEGNKSHEGAFLVASARKCSYFTQYVILFHK